MPNLVPDYNNSYICPKCNHQTPQYVKDWVGLTHEDMTKIWSELYRKGPVLPTTFGMAIEAKLKEKNND